MPSPKIAIINGNLNTMTGNQDFTKPGFAKASEIKAVMFEYSYPTSYNSVLDGNGIGVGFSDGTNQRTVFVSDRHNVGSMYSIRNTRSDACIYITGINAGIILGIAVFGSFIENGVRINITDAFPLNYKVKVTLFANVDAYVGSIEHSLTQDVEVSTTDPGFEPDQILFINARDTDNQVSSLYRFTFGAASNNNTIQQSSTNVTVNGPSTSDCGKSIRDNRISHRFSGAINYDSIELTSFDENGFTVATRDSASISYVHYYLALKFNGLKHSVNVVSAPSDTGENLINIGYRPQYILMILSGDSDTINVFDTTDIFGIGIGSFTEEDLGCLSVSSEDNVATTNTQSSMSNDRVVDVYTDDGNLSHRANFVEIRNNGFVLNYSQATSGRLFVIIGIGQAIPEPTLKGEIALSYGDLTRLGDSFDGDSQLSTSFIYSDDLSDVNEIVIEVTGDTGDSDDVEVYQFNKLSNYDTDGHLLGTIALDEDNTVVKTFYPNVTKEFRIGLRMQDSSTETPNYKGSYA